MIATREKAEKRAQALNRMVPEGSPISYEAVEYRDSWAISQRCHGKHVGIAH